MTDSELALFDLLSKKDISKADRERVKQASKSLLASLRELLKPMPGWMEKAATQAQVKTFILDSLYRALPRPPFDDAETDALAAGVYDFVWQQRASGAISWRRSMVTLRRMRNIAEDAL